MSAGNRLYVNRDLVVEKKVSRDFGVKKVKGMTENYDTLKEAEIMLQAIIDEDKILYDTRVEPKGKNDKLDDLSLETFRVVLTITNNEMITVSSIFYQEDENSTFSGWKLHTASILPNEKTYVTQLEYDVIDPFLAINYIEGYAVGLQSFGDEIQGGFISYKLPVVRESLAVRRARMLKERKANK